MKIVIEKKTNKLGDEYLDEEEIIADIWRDDDRLIIEVDNTRYIIPFKIITCLGQLPSPEGGGLPAMTRETVD